MIEIQEDRTNKKIKSPTQSIDKSWTKYNKRMDDIIDNVEIEAEIEAEKKIRSKNSRLVTISSIGIALLVLIFIKVQQHANGTEPIIDKKPLADKAAFSQQKTLPVISQVDQLPQIMPESVKTITKVSVKPKNIVPRVISSGSTAKNNETGKASTLPSVKQKANGSDAKYFVQLGAFSIKKNAEEFSKKVESNGFQPVLSVRNTKFTQYKVYIENFSEKNKAGPKQADLKAFGFTSSIEKIDNAYTLKLGTFQNANDSNYLIEKLRNRGFKPKLKKVLVEDKTYTVGVKGLANKNEAQKTRQKLASHGFKNSFIR